MSNIRYLMFSAEGVLNAAYRVLRYAPVENPVPTVIFNFRKDERLRLHTSCRVSSFAPVETPTYKRFSIFVKTKSFKSKNFCSFRKICPTVPDLQYFLLFKSYFFLFVADLIFARISVHKTNRSLHFVLFDKFVVSAENSVRRGCSLNFLKQFLSRVSQASSSIPPKTEVFPPASFLRSIFPPNAPYSGLFAPKTTFEIRDSKIAQAHMGQGSSGT